MTILSQIEDLVTNTSFECPSCGSQPDDPRETFTIFERHFSSDFDIYKCSSCKSTFRAVFCECGRGYRSNDDFIKIIKNGNSTDDIYMCDCGEVLHTE